MSEFTDLIDTHKLIVLKTTTDEAATRYVRKQLDDEGDAAIAVWGWTAEKGIHPLLPEDDESPGLVYGTYRDSVAEAVTRFQHAEEDRFLLFFGAEAYPVELGIQVALGDFKSRAKRGSAGLVCLGDELPVGLLDRVDTPAEELTLNLREPALDQPPPVHKDRAKIKMDLVQLKEVKTFDTPDWTEHLNSLSPRDLATICEQGLYKPSVTRINALSGDLDKLFVGKRELIDVMSWCAVAHLPMLLLGTWGTGKSMLVREFSAGLGISPRYRSVTTEDEFVEQLKQLKGSGVKTASWLRDMHEARHFEYLVTRFTTPEELLGPVDVDLLLSHAVYLRQTRALMPRAEIVFLDEVFKANSSILNALLSLINERLFYNAGVPWAVNMVMLFGASNEPPGEEELGAFFDRFPIRTLCDPVSNAEVPALIERSHALQYASLLPTEPTREDLNILDPKEEIAALRMSQTACVNDFRLLRKVALYMFGGPDVRGPGEKSKEFVDEFTALFLHLRDQYTISDRSAGHLFRLARCKALLDRREEEGLTKDDLAVFHFCGKDAETLRELRGVVDELRG